IYTVRLIVTTFHGEPKSDKARHAEPGRGLVHGVPLVVLAVLSTFLGAWITPPLEGVLPMAEEAGHGASHTTLEIVAAGVALAGIALGMWLFLVRRAWLRDQVAQGWGARLRTLWYTAWGFDAFFDRTLVRPYQGMVARLRGDPIDRTGSRVAWLVGVMHRGLSRTQTGRLRWYATSMVIGATVVVLLLTLGA
ncbi:NADH-quinone oxidoreductase subunit L, partial [Halomonas sp. BBD45]|nr:NADH-quinone oxidoreductase subunit L [Halomonas sp. BBD45]